VGAVFSKSLLFSKIVAMIAVASIASGGTPVIGLITASGHFTVERSRVWGNSTLFDGAMVETDTSSSQLALATGAKVQLAAGSRAHVWSNRVQLEKGVGQLADAGSYEMDAAGLKISAGESNGRLRVALGSRTEVAALSGPARVSTSSGLLLATIPAGRSMAFAPQAAQGIITRTGCLLYKDGHYILQDDNTQEVVEVNGRDLAPSLGNHVQVTGTAGGTKPAVSIATLVVNATAVTTQSSGGCLSSATALNAQTQLPANAGGAGQPAASPSSAPRPSGGGMSTGAKIAIVGAIAGGGAGAAIALSGKKSSTSQ
jgi:hypothetical protein